MIIFCATPDDDVSVAIAREYLRSNNLTGDEARLVKRDGSILIIDKGETWRRLKPTS